MSYEAISIKYLVIRHANGTFSVPHYNLFSSVACLGTIKFSHIIS
jgi:hypothetical protein